MEIHSNHFPLETHNFNKDSVDVAQNSVLFYGLLLTWIRHVKSIDHFGYIPPPTNSFKSVGPTGKKLLFRVDDFEPVDYAFTSAGAGAQGGGGGGVNGPGVLVFHDSDISCVRGVCTNPISRIQADNFRDGIPDGFSKVTRK